MKDEWQLLRGYKSRHECVESVAAKHSRGGRDMSGEERLKQIDPGTGLTLEELIDAFITDPREAKRLKAYLSRDRAKEGEV